MVRGLELLSCQVQRGIDQVSQSGDLLAKSGLPLSSFDPDILVHNVSNFDLIVNIDT